MENDKYIGRLLDGRYEILEVIGTGGMAVVYKARCHRLNRLVAIKILKDELSKDEEFRNRFHGESQAVAMLSHPNIMSVYDVSTHEDADYIVHPITESLFCYDEGANGKPTADGYRWEVEFYNAKGLVYKAEGWPGEPVWRYEAIRGMLEFIERQTGKDLGSKRMKK